MSLYPWRAFDAVWQKRLFLDNASGAWLLNLLFCLEECIPAFFVRHFQYPMVALTKCASRT